MMGLCVDIGHTWRANVDPTKAVLELRDRVYDFHVKDLRDLKDRDSQVIVGKGASTSPRSSVRSSRSAIPGTSASSARSTPTIRCRDAAVVRVHMRGVLRASRRRNRPGDQLEENAMPTISDNYGGALRRPPSR